MAVYNATNPVAPGLATLVDHYDRVFNNTVAIYDSLRGIVELHLPMSAFRPHASGGCGPVADVLLSSGRYIAGAPFGASAIEAASLAIRLPKRWNLGTFTFEPYGFNTAGGSGAIVLQMAGVAVSNDDSLDAATGSSQSSTDTILAANDLMVGPESNAITIAGTPAYKDLLRLVLQRDPTAVGDTYGSPYYVHGVIVRITVTEPTDA